MKMLPDDGGVGGGAGGANTSPVSSPSPFPSPSVSPPGPSATPGSEGGQGPSPQTGSYSLPFIEIPDMGDLDGFVDSTVRETPAAPVVEGGATLPQAQPLAAPVQPVAPTQQAPQATQVAAPQPAVAASPAMLPMSQQLTAAMAVLIPQMAEAEGFKLTEEEIAELDINPVAALQKAQARTYVNTLRYMHNHLESELPKLIQAGVQEAMANQAVQTETRTKVTSMLKSQFPSIDPANPQHAEALSVYTRMYRQANPQATLEQVIQDVGTMVTHKLKLTATPVIQPMAKAAPTFAPATGATQNGTGGAPPPDNPFAGLASNFD